jgi:hypothetical protein
MISWERERPDSSYSELPFPINSTWKIISVRRFSWTSYYGSGCPPSSASCGAPARYCDLVEKMEGNKERLRRGGVAAKNKKVTTPP